MTNTHGLEKSSEPQGLTDESGLFDSPQFGPTVGAA